MNSIEPFFNDIHFHLNNIDDSLKKISKTYIIVENDPKNEEEPQVDVFENRLSYWWNFFLKQIDGLFHGTNFIIRNSEEGKKFLIHHLRNELRDISTDFLYINGRKIIEYSRLDLYKIIEIQEKLQSILKELNERKFGIHPEAEVSRNIRQCKKIEENALSYKNCREHMDAFIQTMIKKSVPDFKSLESLSSLLITTLPRFQTLTEEIDLLSTFTNPKEAEGLKFELHEAQMIFKNFIFERLDYLLKEDVIKFNKNPLEKGKIILVKYEDYLTKDLPDLINSLNLITTDHPVILKLINQAGIFSLIEKHIRQMRNILENLAHENTSL